MGECDHTSINAAIGATSDGDVIRLAAETYFDGEQIDTLGQAITQRSVFDETGDPAQRFPSIGPRTTSPEHAEARERTCLRAPVNLRCFSASFPSRPRGAGSRDSGRLKKTGAEDRNVDGTRRIRGVVMILVVDWRTSADSEARHRFA